MSKAFIDRNQQQNSDSNQLEIKQSKIDPVAQLKWLNNQQVDSGFGLFNNSQPAQMFASEEEEEPMQGKAEEEELMQMQPELEEEELIQGKSIEEDEELQMKNGPEGEAERRGGSGTSTVMPDDVRSKMENSFGTDFSGVNVHQNSEQASNIGALAYTQGNDVHFAPGQYNPGSTKGQELLGHELAHVVQQRQGRVKPDAEQKKGMNINSDTSLEKEADEMGEKAAQGKMANVAGKGSGVQKQSEGQEITIDNKPYDIDKESPWPENVNKEELLEKADHNLTAITRAHELLIRSCILAIDKVDKLSDIKDTDVFQLFLQKMVGASVDKILGLNKYLEVAGTIIKAGIESSKSAGAVDGAKKSALTFAEIISELQNFDRNTIAEIQDIDNNLEENYDLTNYVASFNINKSDIQGIEVATTQFEIEVWKKVLPLKWKHMISGNPTFHKNISWIPRNEGIHKNCYYTYKAGSKWGLFSDTEGYYVTEHWLGSGGHSLTHDKAPKELAVHLFNNLGVSREDLFGNWNLPIQTFHTGEQSYGFGPR